jgi:1,4-alpha-glucan branching enzyme
MNPDPIFSQLQSFFEGWGAETWRSLGAWPVDLPHAAGGRGWRFAVWAPSAQAVGVVGDLE